jgi:outer membrane protein, heavy metal efflux system
MPSFRRFARPGWALIALALLGPSGSARADELPPLARLRAAITSRPDVRAATALLDADRADAERLQQGTGEFVLRASLQQRRVNDAAVAARYGEGQIVLERPWRSTRKAERDTAVGDALLAWGQVRRADAVHEATRTWLRLWFDWLRERESLAMWQQQLSAQQDLTRQAERRVKAGDLARTELDLQQAAVLQLQAAVQAAEARARGLMAQLDAQYPGLTDGLQPALERPTQSTPVSDSVEHELVERSHELSLARLRADLAQAQSRRSEAEQRPDPTVGVFLNTERGGSERIIGMSLSLPLPFPGGARAQVSRAARATAEEAALRAEEIERRVRAEAAVQRLALGAAVETWRLQAQARERSEAVYAALRKGWQLGEFTAAEVTLARRQALDAALAEVAARAEARYQALRLQLDLHQILEFDD